MRQGIALAVIALLVGCAKKDPNVPSTGLFEQIIRAAPSAATQPVCQSMVTGLNELPKEARTTDTHGPEWSIYRGLRDLGYVEVQPVSLPHPFGGTVPGVRASLTEKGKAAFGQEYDQKRCVGVWKAGSVKSFTEPATMAGMRVTRVTVTGQQSYTGWAADPQVRGLLRVPALSAEAERTVTLVLENAGWQVMRGQ